MADSNMSRETDCVGVGDSNLESNTAVCWTLEISVLVKLVSRNALTMVCMCFVYKLELQTSVVHLGIVKTFVFCLSFIE